MPAQEYGPHSLAPIDVNQEWRISLAAELLPRIVAQGGRTPREAARAAFRYADAFIRECDERDED